MKSSLSLVLQALADETRRALLSQVAEEAKPVGELSPPETISAPAISRHLRVLERAALISRKRRGRQLLIRLNPAPLADARAFLETLGRNSHVEDPTQPAASSAPEETDERFEGIEDLDDDEMASLL